MQSTKKYPALFQFLKIAENAALAGGNLDYIRHKSPEGGLDTIGYGHKLTHSEAIKGSVYGFDLESFDIDAAEIVLCNDIERHEALVRLNSGAYGYSFDQLDTRRQEMLIEINFNVGNVCRKFPNFTKAVYAGDEETMKKEHHRHYHDIDGVRKPLTSRNDLFEETWFPSE